MKQFQFTFITIDSTISVVEQLGNKPTNLLKQTQHCLLICNKAPFKLEGNMTALIVCKQIYHFLLIKAL